MAKNKKWHHIADEYAVSLFPIFMMPDAFFIEIKNITGEKCVVAEKIENNSVIYVYLPEYWQKAHNALVNKIRKNPKFLNNVYKITKQEGIKQVEFTKKIASENLKNKSNKQLNSYYQKYVKMNTNLYGYGLILPILDFHETTFLSDEVNKFLNNKKAKKYFNILTASTQDTYNKLQDLNLLKIYSDIKKIKSLNQKFKKLEAFDLNQILQSKHKKIWKRINNHVKKYAWVHYVYEGPASDESYFIDIIRDFARRNIYPSQELKIHKQNKNKLKKEQKIIIKKLNPNSYYNHIISLARDAIFYKPYRRELQTQSYYYMEFLLREIAKRLNLSLKQVRMMLPEEIEDGLVKNKININNINKRLKLVIYYRKPNKKICLTGKRALNFCKEIKKEKIDKNIKEITGTTACPGKAKGIIKLINSPEDMKKMETGNILVSASTNPNLMPAIRKSGAIITDEGGLTSHAAIVSREFKIPCIIGTKIATKVLKDGDKVEVNANKGIVKKL